MKTTVIDVSNPASPRRVGGNSLFAASDVLVAGTSVFVAAQYSGLVILTMEVVAKTLRTSRQNQFNNDK